MKFLEFFWWRQNAPSVLELSPPNGCVHTQSKSHLRDGQKNTFRAVLWMKTTTTYYLHFWLKGLCLFLLRSIISGGAWILSLWIFDGWVCWRRQRLVFLWHTLQISDTIYYCLVALQGYDTPTGNLTLTMSLNKPLNNVLPTKCNIQNIINTLELGEFGNETRIDHQDPAAQHALNAQAHLKILNPPRSYAEAIRFPHADKWTEACDTEMNMVETMKIWRMVDKPKSFVPIRLKWGIKYKMFNDNRNPIKFTACLVEKGLKQHQGIDVSKNFAPTATF